MNTNLWFKGGIMNNPKPQVLRKSNRRTLTVDGEEVFMPHNKKNLTTRKGENLKWQD